MSTRSQTVFDEMIAQNQELFKEFTQIHELYEADPGHNRSKYNEVGDRVMNVIKQYESRLCKHSENSGFGQFSGGLAGKFWELIRAKFPLIDEVGLL